MDIRYAVHPKDFKKYTTEEVRQQYLIEEIFKPNKARLVYSHDDRIIIGGICPQDPIKLEGSKEIGAHFFLERRELGVINLGDRGTIITDEGQYQLNKGDGLYIGMGTENVTFISEDSSKPAKFYLASGPAHKTYPVSLIKLDEVMSTTLGSEDKANVRTINKYIHPDGVASCQLVMGLTKLESNSVWNTMPCHTHDRRMEVYLYCDMSEQEVVLHLMGQPNETRHIVVRNEEAVISPNWSIHSGVGTKNYSFIWAMVGENQTFDDMDHVAMEDLK